MFRNLIFFLLVALLVLSGCNSGEGVGGIGTIEGKVMLVLHPDDNFTLQSDTVVASKTDVYIVYGDDSYLGDDVETDENGRYRFKYLKPGRYKIYAYSTLPSGERLSVSETVELANGKTVEVPTIYIHSGKAYGTSIVKGRVYAKYYHNGNFRGEGWAAEQRVYIKRQNDEFYFDDVRTSQNGIFYFQKLQKGSYKVYTFTEDLNEVPSPVEVDVNVDEVGNIYEIQDTINVIINV